MKKYLRNLTIFALLFISIKVFGQGHQHDNGWEPFLSYSMPFDERIPLVGPEVGGDDPPPPTIYRTIMTYNIQKRRYSSNAKIMKNSGAHIVAVQEIMGIQNFNTLKKDSGMDGVFLALLPGAYFWTYGIALLWRPEIGTPSSIKVETVLVNPFNDKDIIRGFIIAEWDFHTVVSTHITTAGDGAKTKMIDAILNHNKIKNNSSKRIFIAGDMNFEPKNKENLRALFTAKGFVVLNDEEGAWWDTDNQKYMYPESNWTVSGKMIDLIFGKQKNPPNYIVIEKGVVDAARPLDTYSDHLPFIVKVKF